MLTAWGYFAKRKKEADPAIHSAAPTFSRPNEAEANWMLGHLQFAAAHNVNLDDPAQIASLYDLLVQSWFGSAPEERSDPNTSINIIATVFGEHLVRRTTMEWVVATDSFGTELAVLDTATDLLVYPANAVAKRWTANEPGTFIGAMANDIAHRLGSEPR